MPALLCRLLSMISVRYFLSTFFYTVTLLFNEHSQLKKHFCQAVYMFEAHQIVLAHIKRPSDKIIKHYLVIVRTYLVCCLQPFFQFNSH